MPATTNSPVRIKSAGDDGDVTQANLSGAFSAAGNANDTTQSVSQDAGSGHPVLGPLSREGGCGSCGGDGATVQAAGQWASSKQNGRLVGGLDAEGRLQHQLAGSDQEQRRRR